MHVNCNLVCMKIWVHLLDFVSLNRILSFYNANKFHVMTTDIFAYTDICDKDSFPFY